MDKASLAERVHDLDVTVWVGKNGIEAVRAELDNQLADRELVKVKFLRSALAGTGTDDLAAELAELTEASVVETRGHTAVMTRD
jgi:RNA-binding protein